MIRVSEMSEELNYSLVPETCVYPVAGLRIPDPPNEKQLQAVGLYTILGLRACVGKHGPLLKGTEHTHDDVCHRLLRQPESCRNLRSSASRSGGFRRSIRLVLFLAVFGRCRQTPTPTSITASQNP